LTFEQVTVTWQVTVTSGQNEMSTDYSSMTYVIAEFFFLTSIRVERMSDRLSE
jgi:hypothetical protein